MDTPVYSPAWKRPRWGALSALAGVAGLTGLRVLLDPLLGDRAAFVFYFPLIIAVAWVWGLRISLLTCHLSLLAAWFIFVPQRFSFTPGSPQDLVSTGVNAITMSVCSLVGALGRRARIRERLASAHYRESEERFRAAFEHAPIGVVELDLHTNQILRLNHEYARIIGRDAAEIVGKRPIDYTHPDDIPADHEYQQMAIERRPIRRHKRYIRPDGAVVWVEVRANVVHEGGPPRLVGLV